MNEYIHLKVFLFVKKKKWVWESFLLLVIIVVDGKNVNNCRYLYLTEM